MATKYLQSLTEKDKRGVGNLNSLKIKTVAHGAIAEEDADNFTLVELNFNSEGERTFKPLSEVSKQAYLLAAPERRYGGETIGEFFVGKGERARIVVLEDNYTRFETSEFTGDPSNGKFAHFDVAEKKFKIHDGTDSDYAGAAAKFLVVSSEEDMDYTLGQPLVRFEVISNSPVVTPAP